MKTIEEIRKTPNLFIEAEAKNDGIGGKYYDKYSGKYLNFIFSYQLGWEHLSVSMPNKTPSWDQMCVMKDIFWNKNETCVEYHPKEEDYVNNHKHCLHIWRPAEQELLTPPSILVGFKNDAQKYMILKNCKEQGIKINNWKYNKREREKQSNG
jgi:hypothetical protein